MQAVNNEQCTRTQGCGEPRIDGRKYCLRHASEWRTKRKPVLTAKYARLRDEGRCQGCEGKLDYPGLFRKCSKCRKYYREYLKRRAEKRRAAGLCVRCGDPRVGRSRFCTQHFVETSARSAGLQANAGGTLLAVFASCGGACYLCGTLGGVWDFHLDHVLPKSRFPELSTDINNLKWACKSCNLGKRDMTPPEYRAHCKLVAHKSLEVN